MKTISRLLGVPLFLVTLVLLRPSVAAAQADSAAPDPAPKPSAPWSPAKPGGDVLPGDIAIRLASESTVLGKEPAKIVIDRWLKAYVGNLIVLGWNASASSDDTYLVSYTFNGDSLQKGWFFDVKVPSRAVTNVSGDRRLEAKAHVRRCPASEAEDVKLGFHKKRTTPGKSTSPVTPDLPLCVEP